MQVPMRAAGQVAPDFYPPSWLVIVAALVVLMLIGSSTSMGPGMLLGGMFGLGTFLLFIFRSAVWAANNADPTAQGAELLTQLSIVLTVWIGIFGLIGVLARE